MDSKLAWKKAWRNRVTILEMCATLNPPELQEKYRKQLHIMEGIELLEDYLDKRDFCPELPEAYVMDCLEKGYRLLAEVRK